MEAITLSDLGPIIAAVLGPMLAFVVVSMRYQHKDSTKTRELISESNKETREEASRQIERATDRLSTEFAEHRRVAERRHSEVTRSLGDARERLARIEGHFRIGAPPLDENAPDEESGKAA